MKKYFYHVLKEKNLLNVAEKMDQVDFNHNEK